MSRGGGESADDRARSPIVGGTEDRAPRSRSLRELKKKKRRVLGKVGCTGLEEEE